MTQSKEAIRDWVRPPEAEEERVSETGLELNHNGGSVKKKRDDLIIEIRKKNAKKQRGNGKATQGGKRVKERGGEATETFRGPVKS